MGKFTFTQTEIPGVVVIEPQVFGDARGWFMESWSQRKLAAAGSKKLPHEASPLRYRS